MLYLYFITPVFIRGCTIELIILELSFDVCRKLEVLSRLGRIILVKASIVIATCMVSFVISMA